jgi:proline iminopeptidase
VPTIIVQGRMDMICPPRAALSVAQSLANAELRMIENAGHASSQPVLAAALRQAADDMRGRVLK